ncbi:MAG: ligand-binding sensor domain-containing protein/two-component sensor histidine kinase [Halioglobus sp.]|jgi:ligand-binding sensor domain-containing protein/two-component sensor histidine kinase
MEIFQDSSYNFWIGTQNGLFRFDGIRLEKFSSGEPSPNWIPSSNITDLAEDASGSIIVTTKSGDILKLQNRSDGFQPILGNHAPSDFLALQTFIADNGNIWVSSKNGIALINNEYIVAREWFIDSDLIKITGSYPIIIENSNGQLIIGGKSGLAKLNPQNHTVENIYIGKPGQKENSRVTAMAMANDGTLIIGTDLGEVLNLDTDSETIVARRSIDGRISGVINDLLIIDDQIYIASSLGLFSSAMDLSHFKDFSLGLSDPTVESVHFDGANIWIGTHRGLDILSFPVLERFSEFEAGSVNETLAFEEDSSGRLWLGTYSGLFIYDAERGSHEKYRPPANGIPLADHRVTALFRKEEKIWVGFYGGGLQVMDSLSGEIQRLDFPISGNVGVTSILEDGEYENIWVATYNHGLYRYDGNSFYSYASKPKGLPESAITVLHVSDNGTLLAVALNKIYRYVRDRDSFELLNFDFDIEGNSPHIYSLAENDQGELWIGTESNGVFKWSSEYRTKDDFTLQAIGRGEDTASATIYRIEIDSAGFLWCSTQNGIVKLDNHGRFIERFSLIDGLQDTDFSFGASLTSSSGHIYFGGPKGYNRFHPSEIKTRSLASKMRIVGLEFPGNEQLLDIGAHKPTTLQLTHKDSYITFKFAVLDFLEPDKNQYRYTLENFDPEWIESGRKNTATYTNLPPGEYVFRAQGANSAGIWNREGVSIKVQVLPPPWLMWWAFCTYAGVFALMLWGTHRIYQSYAIDRRAAEMAIEMHAAEEKADDDMQEQLELQQDLVRSAYEHNVSTLSLVGGFITNEAEDRSDGSATPDRCTKRVAALAHLGECVYFQAGGSLANMHEYVDLVMADLIAQSEVDPETIITINDVPSRMIRAEIATPLAVVIYELAQNCLQHAFLPESEANYITIALKGVTGDESYVIAQKLVIRDNGVGAPANIVEAANESSGTGVVHSLAATIGGTVVYAMTSGTTISVTVPSIEFD